jgi:hypothetical protein
MAVSLLKTGKPSLKASSILHRSAEYAVSNVLDDREDTCWNSDAVWTRVLAVFRVGMARSRITVEYFMLFCFVRVRRSGC